MLSIDTKWILELIRPFSLLVIVVKVNLFHADLKNITDLVGVLVTHIMLPISFALTYKWKQNYLGW